MANPWIEFVKSIQTKNPGMTYPEALMKAKKDGGYKKKNTREEVAVAPPPSPETPKKRTKKNKE